MRKNRDLVQKFNEFELNNELFEQEHKGTNIWPLIREKIFFRIEEQLFDYAEKGKRDINLKFGDLFTKGPKIIKNICKYLVTSKKSCEILFVAHPRRVKKDGTYIDIYTDPVIEKINQSTIVVEPMHQLMHFEPSKPETKYYLDFIDLWARGLSFVFKKSLPKEKRLFWKDIATCLSEEFDIESIDIITLIELEVTRQIFAYSLLKKLIININPALIVEVVGYQRFNKTINKIGKELDIPTAELQHGYIGSQHIAYNFPDGIKVNTFSDYLLVWGDFWNRNIKPPIEEERILTNGFTYFAKERNRVEGKTKAKDQVLFISQGTIGPEIGEFALQLSKNENICTQILFKLHPSELADSEKKYKELYEAQKVTVLDSRDEDLYQLIKDSKAVVGVYSTAIIEALGLGVQTIVLKLPGYEKFFEILNQYAGNIQLVDSTESLVEIVNSIGKGEGASQKSNHSLFAKPDWEIIQKLKKKV